MLLAPQTSDDFADAVSAHPRVLAVGARTKPRLSQVEGDVVLLSTRALSGIVEYDSSEFGYRPTHGPFSVRCGEKLIPCS